MKLTISRDNFRVVYDAAYFLKKDIGEYFTLGVSRIIGDFAYSAAYTENYIAHKLTGQLFRRMYTYTDFTPGKKLGK
eukprot:UN13438